MDPFARFRVHAADVQLTFNKSDWRCQEQTTEAWFAEAGVRLVEHFQTWALEQLPRKFRERIVHTSLTMEESCHASGGVKRVHLHAELTVQQRIDRTSVADFVFDGVQPHVDSSLFVRKVFMFMSQTASSARR